MSNTVNRRLRIKRYGVTNIDAIHYSAYRMRVEVIAAENMDKRVFVYRKDPVDPYTNEETDTFFTVASPADMSEYPADTPDPGNAVPFFRRNIIELDFRTTRLALEAWQLILRELSTLIEAFNRLEDLSLIEDFWIGPFPEDPFHGSISNSSSISEPIP